MKVAKIPTKKVSMDVTEASPYSNLKSNSRLMIIPQQKSRKDGLCMVYIETTFIKQTMDGTSYKPKRVATEIRVAPIHWSKAKQEVKPSHPDYVSYNRKLEASIQAVKSYAAGKVYDTPYLNTLPKELQTFEKHFNIKHRKTLINYLDEYINYRISISVRGTWKEFRTLKGRLEKFQISTGKLLYFEDMTFEWAEEFKQFAKTLELDPNTLRKTFDILTTFLNHYVHDQLKLNFFLSKDYREKKFKAISGTHSSDPTPLYPDEWEKLRKFTPTKPIPYINKKGEHLTLTLNGQYRIKNLFLLSCFSGLRYGDVSSLKKGHFKDDTIIIRASKTDNGKNAKDLHIPIIPPAKEILEEINFDMSKIVLSNQKSNEYLKVLLKEIGIDSMMIDHKYSLNGQRTTEELPKYELVSFHSGRDTFITNCLIAEIDVTTVMSWSGHSKYDTFKKYIRLSENHLKTQHKKADKFFTMLKDEPIQIK